MRQSNTGPGGVVRSDERDAGTFERFDDSGEIRRVSSRDSVRGLHSTDRRQADPARRREIGSRPVHKGTRGADLRCGDHCAYGIVYAIERRCDGRLYVGITQREPVARVTAHVYESRRCGSVREGGLAAAIREAEQSGQTFQEAFSWRVLERDLDLPSAQTAERRWINELSCAAPQGFNLHRGGGAGGPSNARPLTIRVKGEDLEFPSLYAAIRWANAYRRDHGKPELGVGAVYARVVAGWSTRQALGLYRRTDRRSIRSSFHLHGRACRSIAVASRRTGIPPATLRSRLHRARRAGTNLEIGLDRRSGTTFEIARDRHATADRGGALRLPHPTDPRRTVSAAEFAALTNVPKATVLHRAGRLGTQDRALAIRFLTEPMERRRLITLEIPGGTRLRGGVNELIARVVGQPRYERHRHAHIGGPAIKRRLLACGYADLLWAFGFRARQRSPGRR